MMCHPSVLQQYRAFGTSGQDNGNPHPTCESGQDSFRFVVPCQAISFDEIHDQQIDALGQLDGKLARRRGASLDPRPFGDRA